MGCKKELHLYLACQLLLLNFERSVERAAGIWRLPGQEGQPPRDRFDSDRSDAGRRFLWIHGAAPGQGAAHFLWAMRAVRYAKSRKGGMLGDVGGHYVGGNVFEY